MKKLSITFVISLFFVNVSFSQTTTKVKWYSIEEALELNKTNPKKFLIDVYTDWCVWCKKMDHESFSNPIIADYLNKNYYPVKFNAESSTPVVFQGKTYTKPAGTRTHQFAVTLLNGQVSFPSIAYLDEQTQLIGVIPGFKNAKQTEIILNFISNNLYKNSNLDDYSKTFHGKIM